MPFVSLTEQGPSAQKIVKTTVYSVDETDLCTWFLQELSRVDSDGLIKSSSI